MNYRAKIHSPTPTSFQKPSSGTFEVASCSSKKSLQVVYIEIFHLAEINLNIRPTYYEKITKNFFSCIYYD